MIEFLKKYRYILYLILLFVMPLGLKWIYKKYVLHHFLERNKTTEVPSVHHSLHIDNNGRLYYASGGGKWYEEPYEPLIEPSVLDGRPVGTEKGIAFDFDKRGLSGLLLYGLCGSYSDYSYQAEVINGRVEIDILNDFSNTGDMGGWQQTGRLCLSYRLQSTDGKLLFQGKLNVGGFGPFKPLATLASGPLLQAVSSDSAVIVFSTNLPCKPIVSVSGRTSRAAVDSLHHKFVFRELQPDTPYELSITLENYTEVFNFRTFPAVGDQQPFTFAFTANTFGYQAGERDVAGVNMQGIQRAMALAAGNQARFVLFGGNLISGKLPHTGETLQQFQAWKKACNTGRQLMPVFTAMGENESVVRKIKSNDSLLVFCRFPYDTESGEALFGKAFANPVNGPVFNVTDDVSEGEQFPPYLGNTYHFRCANTAFIVLNTHFCLNHNVENVPIIGGNIAGFILNEQLSWVQSVLAQYESDSVIRHVIVVMHSPLFPLSTDRGWFDGDNRIRPWIGGKPHDTGLIERRDELLELFCNKSSKVRAVLSGNEANFSRLKLSNDIPRYSEQSGVRHLDLKREIWQINSGSCGNPPAALKQPPWRTFLSRFETMPALCLFHVHGNGIRLEVLNPETLQRIEDVILN